MMITWETCSWGGFYSFFCDAWLLKISIELFISSNNGTDVVTNVVTGAGLCAADRRWLRPKCSLRSTSLVPGLISLFATMPHLCTGDQRVWVGPVRSVCAAVAQCVPRHTKRGCWPGPKSAPVLLPESS